MPHTFDGFDFGAYPYGVTARDVYAPPARGHELMPLRARAGSAFVAGYPAGRVHRFSVDVEGTSASGLEANRDALLRVLSRRRRRLVSGYADSRFVRASLTGQPSVRQDGPLLCSLDLEFSSEDAYFASASPSGDVRTPALAALPGYPTRFAVDYALTPGGSAPVQPRWIVTNQAGGITPILWTLGVRDGCEQITVGSPVPAGSVLVLDPERGEAWVSAQSAVIGAWAFDDASSPARDLSGNSRDLTASGGVIWRADGEPLSAVDFNGSTGFLDSSAAAFGLTGNITLLARINPDVVNVNQGIAGKGANNAGYGLRLTSAGVVEAKIGNGSSVRTATGTRVLTAGRWYHVALTYVQSSGTLRVYVDGELDAQTAGGAFTPSAAGNNLRAGAPHNPSGGSAEFFDGRIGTVVVLNTTLTRAQVQADAARGWWAALGSQVQWYGAFPTLDPGAAATATIRCRADHGTTAAAPRISAGWRSRYE